MSGLARGIAAGTALGSRMVDIYHQGVEAKRLAELRGRQDEEYARQQEDRKVREGMNQAGAAAAERGYDKNGFATVNPAYEGGPGDTEGSVTKAPVMEDGRRPEQKVLDGMTAAEQFALKNKRFDLAIDAHAKGEQVAAQYREKDRAEAMQRYDLSGNPMELVNHVKRFVRDGVDFDKPTVNEDGSVTVTGKMPDGTRFEQKNLTRQQVKTLFEGYSDPVRAQAAAAKRVQDLQKAAIEVEVKRAGLPAQAFDAGKKVWNEQTKTWSTVPGVEYKTVNGGEGEGQRLIAITYGANGQVGGEVDVTRHVANVNGFSKAERGRADDVAKGVENAIEKLRSQGIGSPELAALSIKANSVASDLIAANRNNQVNLEAGKLADYAMRIAQGDKSIAVKPIEYKYNGIVYGNFDGFVVDGKTVAVNPQQVRDIEAKVLADKREAASPRMAPERPPSNPRVDTNPRMTRSPDDFPKVSPTEQAGRDSDRVRVLEGELAAERAKPNANPDNIAALEREIALVRKQSGQAPSPSPAATAPTAPATAAPDPATAAPPMSSAPRPVAAAMPKPAMAGAVIPAEERAARMAQLTDVSNRATAVLNSRSATPAQMSEARTALRDVRAQLKELGSSFTPETARLQAVIANPASSPAEVADARATMRAIRERSSATASLPMSQ